MADRISELPNAILSHILSFLPTTDAMVTTFLSKRWNNLWRSCPSLSFDDLYFLSKPWNDLCGGSCPSLNLLYLDFLSHYRNNPYSRFVQSVNFAILLRDRHQTVQSFSLRCRVSLCGSANVSIWINAVVQRGVQHLNLCVTSFVNLPSAVLTCKTLVVLKLDHFFIKDFSTLDFPLLKIMHLRKVGFSEHRHFAELVSAGPNLEELEAVDLTFHCRAVKGRFKNLPKLVRATVSKIDVPLVVLTNVRFLRLDGMDRDEVKVIDPSRGVNVFRNLIHIEFVYKRYTKDWVEVFEVLKFCHELQVLTIDKMYSDDAFHQGDERTYWRYPKCVPVGIWLHLKTCCLNNYKGSEGEFRFADYIMGNAGRLQTMSICFSNSIKEGEQKLEMIKKLRLCTRHSASCEFIFHNY